MSVRHACVQTDVLMPNITAAWNILRVLNIPALPNLGFSFNYIQKQNKDIWHEAEVGGSDNQAVNKPISGAEEGHTISLHHERHGIMYSDTAERSCAIAHQQHWEELKSWNKEWDTTMVTDAPQSQQCVSREARRSKVSVFREPSEWVKDPFNSLRTDENYWGGRGGGGGHTCCCSPRCTFQPWN